MGSYSYDRDVYSGSSYSNWGTSDYSATKFTRNMLDNSLKPNGKKIVSNSKNPIIIVLDVSGSNINFAKLVYDKLPMFYGEIEKKGYLDDFDICICAVGDAKYDQYPIQIGTPAKGLEIDSWLEKIVLEAGGGSNLNESYEIMAHYLANNCEFADDAKPVVFYIADEMALKNVDHKECEQLGIECAGDYNPWNKLNEKFDDNVYVMLNKYRSAFRDEITESWRNVVPPQHLIQIPKEKAIVDLMLGILALQKEELYVYALDMAERGQTAKRIEGVKDSLQELADTLALSTKDETNLPAQKGKTLVKKGRRL